LVADRDDLISTWLNALSRELELLPRRVELQTLFVGGGTPTHLNRRDLGLLLDLISEHFQLAPGIEFTFEANPDGLDDDVLEVLAEHGVNRLSLGIQSFDTDVLTCLERTHLPQQAGDAVHQAVQRIGNVSLDLIFGVPAQSLSSWETTLEAAVALPVTHISTYGLTFEKGTSFYQRRAQSEFSLPSSELERQQYAAAMDCLAANGYQQYEISNFARSGFQCQHNNVYWDAAEYHAFGPGAARYVNGIRSTNSRNVTRWIESWLDNHPLLQNREQLSEEDRAREAVMLGLRRNKGIALQQFANRFKYDAMQLAPDNAQRHIDSGLLELAGKSTNNERLRLTRNGRFLADTVMTDFL